MIPILFEHSANIFNTYGIGSLVDAVRCSVSMKESQYEMQLVYPIDGEWFAELTQQRIIYAKPCQTDNAQPFRIYRISKPIDGNVTVYARHVSYDLLGIPILPFKATSASDFVTKITQNAAVTCPFTFTTNISKTEDLEFVVPTPARSLVCGTESSWQSVYGGELLFDGFSVNLRSAVGQNRGVVIRYGVDIVDAQMEENISETYTGILPYYFDEQSSTLVVGTVLTASGSYLHTKILPVNLFDYIVESNPTQAKVNEVGQVWLDENLIGYPKVNLSLSYAQIDQIVRQYDTVTVKIEKIGIDVVAKVSETVYDVINERYDSVNIGDTVESIYKDIYDASRLKTGLLDMKRIKDESITSKKLGGGCVTSSKMGTGSVLADAIAAGAITEVAFSTGAVSSRALQLGAVTAGKIAENAVGISSCDGTITGYFNGTKTFPIKTNNFYINGRHVYIGESGELIAEHA